MVWVMGRRRRWVAVRRGETSILDVFCLDVLRMELYDMFVEGCICW